MDKVLYIVGRTDQTKGTNPKWGTKKRCLWTGPKPFAAKPTARTSISTSTSKKPKYTDNNEYENDSKWAEIEQHNAIAENIIGGRDVHGRLTASDVAVASNNDRMVKVRVTSEQAELDEPTLMAVMKWDASNNIVKVRVNSEQAELDEPTLMAVVKWDGMLQ